MIFAAHEPVGVLAAKFHNTLAEMIVAVAKRAGMSARRVSPAVAFKINI